MAQDMKTGIQTFFCIGAQKAGTTTLADILSQHTQIYIPAIKETKFFLFPDDYQKGTGYYNAQYFSNYSGQKAAGEFDPDYLLFPETAGRIAETLGTGMKFIVVLRNPADRAYSHYLMSKKKGVEKLSFTDALAAEPKRKTDIKTEKIFAYTGRGFYGKQVSAFLKYFPKENFLFLVFEEDILRNMAQTVRQVQAFLGVPYEELDVSIHSNEAGEPVSESVRNLVRKPNFAKRIAKMLLPSEKTRKSIRRYFIRKNMKKASSPKLDDAERNELIRKYFLDDIRLTEQITGKDLGAWYK